MSYSNTIGDYVYSTASALIDYASGACNNASKLAVEAQRELAVLGIGLEGTPITRTVMNLGVVGVGAAISMYGTYKMFRASSKVECLKYGLVAGIGAAFTVYQAGLFTEKLIEKGIAACTDSHTNRFPGWEKCADLAVGSFSYLRR